MGTMIDFRANGRTAQGYLSLPSDGSGPGLLVLQEWWGLVPHIKDVADRFAAAGFVALAPDLYHGESTTHPDDAQRLLMAMNMSETAQDLKGAADYLRTLPALKPAKVGVVGFCLGGQLALYAATAHPEAIQAVVDFYGIFNPKVPVDLTALRAPVQGHFGDHDRSIPRERVDGLMKEIAATGVEHDVFFYDAGHAFFNDTRAQVYSADAAGAAWARAVEFLTRHLA